MKKNTIFNNIDSTKKPKTLLDIIKWKLSSKSPIWPKNLSLVKTDKPPLKVSGKKIRISYVGHVTFLIQFEGLNILTDPVWSDRASPFSFVGPKRVIPPGIKFNDLPPIDLILISHNHYDHLDIPTLKKLCARDNPYIITPLENDVIIKSHIRNANIKTLNWYENDKFKDIEIALEPAQHWSARGLFDKNRALWGTFLIKTKKGYICFIGDTGYDNQIFKIMGKKYPIILSLIPIGAFEPRWFMKDVHINPEEAVLIHQDLNSACSLASHYETFPLADDNFNQAANELREARIKYNILDNKFILSKTGKYYLFQ